MKPNELIEAARLWLGTPYHDQASLIFVGADCIGFPKGVIRDFGYDVSEVPRAYSRNSQPEILMKYLKNSTLVKEDESKTLKPGRIVLFNIYKMPHHFGIITDTGFIHADVRWGVIETPLGKWMERVHSVWVPVMLEEEFEVING